jgi:hypothetical protein
MYYGTGTITRSRGAYRAFRSDQGLVNAGVSKTVFYGIKEAIDARNINRIASEVRYQTFYSRIILS